MRWQTLCRSRAKPSGRQKRESYIDGIWNKESVSEWRTEVQLPIK